MRALPARRKATSALCAALLLAITGPAAAAADHDSTRGAPSIAARAPVPEADALLVQVNGLGDLFGVLKPVTDLLGAVLEADSGRLPAADATELSDAVEEAIAKAFAAAPAATAVTPPVKAPREQAAPATPTAPAKPTTPAKPAKPTTPAVPTTPVKPVTPDAPASPASPATPVTPVAPPAVLPAGPKLPAAPVLPLPNRADRAAAHAPPDLQDDALKALQSEVDSLVKASTGGDVTGVAPAALGVVTGLVNVLAATVLGGGLPEANMPGLPKLPLPADAPPTGGLLPS